MAFSTQREELHALKLILFETLQEARNLENVDFILVFTVYSAMSHFARTTKIEATERAALLQRCNDGAQEKVQNSPKIVETS